MNPFLRISLRYSIPLLVIGAFLIASVFSYLDAARRVRADVENRAISDVGNRINALQNELETVLRHGDTDAARSILANRGALPNTKFAMAADAGGIIVASTDLGLIGMDWRGSPQLSPGERKIVADALQQDADYAGTEPYISPDRETISNVAPVCWEVDVATLGVGECGAVFYAESIRQDLRISLSRLKTQALTGAAGTGLIALALSFVLHILLGRRVEEAVAVTTRFGTGDADARIRMKGKDEIARLAGAVDAMLDEIEKAREAVQVAEVSLRQAHRMEAIGHLTGGVAHDFNNLLAILGGNLELLDEKLGDRPELRDFAKMGLQAVERGATLTRSLLAFARQQPLSPQAVDLKKLVQDIADLVRRTVPENIEIAVVAGAGLWNCEADPGQLQNALLNLIANARDAMPEGGRMTIETGNARLDEEYAAKHADVTPGQYVMLAVSDTGHGMPPEVVARAFDPFFTTKGPGLGSGLGLSMVYGFAKQSRGQVKIYSEAGHGTTVRIYLPKAAAAEEERPAIAAAAAHAGKTIIVVEDDADVRTLTRTRLELLGYRVLEAGDPQQALRVVRDDPRIALLLTDVVLPGGMNGPKLAEEIRRLRPGVKVLYMSGYTENAILHQGRLEPGVHLLQKPFTKGELASKILAVLNARRA